MNWGVNTVEMDRWITGNYGEDFFTPCENCDNIKNCEYDLNHYDCKADRLAAIDEAKWELENDR